MVETADTIDDRGPAVLAVTTALLVLSTIFIILRLISRIGVVKKVSTDDYFIVLAWVITFGMSFSICYGTSVGLGKHEANVESQDQNALKKCQYTFSVLYNPALMATKTSIGLFYLTLAKNQQIFKWSTITTLVVVNVAGTALTFLNIFQCRPVKAGYENIEAVTHCTDIVTLYLSSAPVNIITDLALLFLPMPILTAMRLPRNEKIILVITFSFGAFVAVVDVIRIAYLQSASLARLQDPELSIMARQADFSWNASLSFMWSAIEVHVGIICACVPGIKPLATRLFPNLLGRITHSIHRKSRFSADYPKCATAVDTTQFSSPPASPIRARHSGLDHQDGEMGLMDFLTAPNMKAEEIGTNERVNTPDLNKSLTRARTSATVNSKKSRSASLTIFDFVNVKHSKNMVGMSNREALGPLAFVTVLFFLWGFAYGLLDILNSQFQKINKNTPGQVVGLHSAYFGAYFVAPLTFGRIVFRKWGFKATFITGLCIYACGTLVFWPSAVLASFPAFLISNFIVGLGVATLEIAGNPFIALCGPPQYAEARLNISQAIQAVGTVASPLLAKKVFFKHTVDEASLIDIQWTYLGIALFDVILAVIFFYVPLPEASDNDLEQIARKQLSLDEKKIGGVSVVYITLGLGMFSQFCYVGGQEAVSGVFQNYVDFVKPYAALSWFDYQTIGHSVFAVGRLLSAVGGLFIKPRRVLMFLYIGVIVTSILAMNLSGYGGIAMIILVLFFESGIFSIIFAMCLRGLSTHTKDGAVLLTASISGGAVVPAIMKAVTDHRGPQSVQYGFCVIVAFFAFGSILPLYTALVPMAKRQVDPVRNDSEMSVNPELPMTLDRQNRPSSSARRRNKISSDFPTSEHIEG